MKNIYELFNKVKGFELLQDEVQAEFQKIFNKIILEFPICESIFDRLNFVSTNILEGNTASTSINKTQFFSKLYNSLNFNIEFFEKSLSEINFFIKKGFNEKLWVASNLEELIMHEVGHLVMINILESEFNLEINNKVSKKEYFSLIKEYRLNTIETKIISEYCKIYKKDITKFYDDSFIKNELSDYAKNSIGELVAEIFSLYFRENRKNDLIKIIEISIEKIKET